MCAIRPENCSTSSLTDTHPEGTKIGFDAPPTPFEVRTLTAELYANARCVHSPAGGGAHGHLGMVMPAAQYNALPGAVAWVQPVYPPVPVFAGGVDARAAIQAEYDTNKKHYATTTQVTTDLRSQLIAAINNDYIEVLKNELLGYAEVTPAQILAHITASHGTITTDHLDQNMERLTAAWDPSKPIETIFTNAHRCRQFAEAGGDPITEATAIREILKVLEKSGVFTDGIKAWCLQPVADRTWANMPTFFRNQDIERRRIQGITKNSYAAKASTKEKSTTGLDMAYCWTHGLSTNLDHTSATCNKKATGHVNTATADNMQGGNNTIRRKNGERAVYRRPERANAARRTTTQAEESPAPAPADD